MLLLLLADGLAGMVRCLVGMNDLDAARDRGGHSMRRPDLLVESAVDPESNPEIAIAGLDDFAFAPRDLIKVVVATVCVELNKVTESNAF